MAVTYEDPHIISLLPDHFAPPFRIHFSFAVFHFTSDKRPATSDFYYILILQRYKSSSFMRRQDDNPFQKNKLMFFSGGYRYGCQDDYENQTGVEPIFETV
jgi:hypothetical protein